MHSPTTRQKRQQGKQGVRDGAVPGWMAAGDAAGRNWQSVVVVLVVEVVVLEFVVFFFVHFVELVLVQFIDVVFVFVIVVAEVVEQFGREDQLSAFRAGAVFFFDFADQDFAFAMRAFDGFMGHGIVLALRVMTSYRLQVGKKLAKQ
jgi:hypothetical protein